MNYEGKLYGKVGRRTIPLLLTSADVDQMVREIKRLRGALRIIAGYDPCVDSLMSDQHIAIEALRTDHK